ncbi:unnamed protein product [Clonostachys rhizophaga]|uniref:SRR1-like domain-containing protein n=1 Tax=Clonostachys rhizophaga TaxID=160324 RepID=A0A9N9W562_9HYPO|nr:unnamed protein product [Clonostachys rhizophaga]
MHLADTKTNIDIGAASTRRSIETMDADDASDCSYGSMEATQSEVEENVRRLNDNTNLSPREMKMVQYVKDLYASGARLWTKEMFRNIEADLAQEPYPEEVMIRSMNGVEASVIVPTGVNSQRTKDHPAYFTKGYIDGPWYPAVNFNTYQDLLDHTKNRYTGYWDEKESEKDEPLAEKDQVAITRALSLYETRQSYRPRDIVEYSSLKAIWDENWGNWTKSKVCKELADTIAGIPNVASTIDKVVCFGLGAFSDSGDGEGKKDGESDGTPVRRTMTQHAAALTMATEFGKRVGKGPLKVYTQDPAYTDSEKQVLRDHGIEVVGGSGALGFTYVDSDALVFSIAPNIPVRQIVADIARPAAMVWCTVEPEGVASPKWEVENFGGKWYSVAPWSTDPDSPRTRELVDSYAVYKFPRDERRFGDPTIYVRSD